MQNLDVGAIGIDFGSSRSVIAVVKKRGVDVIANEGSNRETANIVGFGQKERCMGEQAFAQAKSNFKNTVRYFNRLLGVPADYPSLRNETKWISSPVVKNADGRLVHKVTYLGETHEFLPEQITAAMLGKLKTIIRLNNLSDKEAVIAVPNYYTESEKKALLDACRIAELTPSRLISENYAITTGYGIFRKSELKDSKEPRYVVFVDIGSSKFSAFIASFTKEKAHIIAEVNDRDLGARDIDWILLNYYENKFQQESNGLSIFENKKAIIRMIDAIENQRKILSANQESTINVEYIVDEQDLNYVMKRAELETLMQPVLERIQLRCEELFSEIMNNKIEIHSVEILGGATRIPAIQNIIRNVFQKENLMKTLNATESIAKGAATIAAVLSPQFHVIPYTVEDCNFNNINVEWKFINSEMDQEPKTSVLFKKGCTIPNIKSLTFKQTDEIHIRLYYEPPVAGFSPEIGSLIIPPSKPTESDFGIKVRIKLNENGLIMLTDANLIEEYIVEEKIEIKKEPVSSKPVKLEVPAQQQPQAENNNKMEAEQSNAQSNQQQEEQQQPQQQPQQQVPSQEPPQQEQHQEPQYEIKQKKKTRTTAVHPKGNVLYQLTQKQIDDFYSLEATMYNQDRAIQETQLKKNMLEAYIYNMKDKIINGELKIYTVPQQIPAIEHALQENSKWLYGEGQTAQKSVYITKKEELEKLCNPSVLRFKDEENFSYSAEELIRVISDYEKFCNSTEEKYAHILQPQRDIIWNECAKSREWLQNSANLVNNRQKFEDVKVNSNQVEERIKQLNQSCQPIIHTPKPQPVQKEEKKVENKPQQNGDTAVEEEPQTENNDNNQEQKMDVEN